MSYKFCVITLFLFAAITSCTKEYSQEDLLEDVLSNDSEAIIDNFYKKDKLEKEAFGKVVHDYSLYLNANDFTKITYRDSFNFRSKNRHGYYFLDQDSNFVASITYKYVMLQDSSFEVNFIDFRNSTNELPCIKFPSRFPIKCIALPNELPINPSIINKEYPKIIAGHKFYHTQSLDPSNLLQNGDTLKTPIEFNNGNKVIRRNLKSILNTLDKSLDLNDYTLAETLMVGEPTINISYYAGSHSQELINKIRQAVAASITSKIEVISRKRPAYSRNGLPEPISIGYAN